MIPHASCFAARSVLVYSSRASSVLRAECLTAECLRCATSSVSVDCLDFCRSVLLVSGAFPDATQLPPTRQGATRTSLSAPRLVRAGARYCKSASLRRKQRQLLASTSPTFARAVRRRTSTAVGSRARGAGQGGPINGQAAVVLKDSVIYLNTLECTGTT